MINKKVISFLLCCLLVFTSISPTAFASENLKEVEISSEEVTENQPLVILSEDTESSEYMTTEEVSQESAIIEQAEETETSEYIEPTLEINEENIKESSEEILEEMESVSITEDMTTNIEETVSETSIQEELNTETPIEETTTVEETSPFIEEATTEEIITTENSIEQETTIEDTTENNINLTESIEETIPEVTIEKEPESMEESTSTTNEEVELDDEVKIDNVIIKVNGIFSESGKLEVKKVDIAKDLSNNTVAQKFSFDIKVLNELGEELQPIGKVNVSFTFLELNTNLTPEVYHEEELLESEIVNNEIIVESDGFSIYTVEFVYADKEYILQGKESVKLSELLSNFNISGNIISVEISDDNIISLAQKDNDWILTSIEAFTTQELLKVNINNTIYEIIITDAIPSGGAGGTLGRGTGGNLYWRLEANGTLTIRPTSGGGWTSGNTGTAKLGKDNGTNYTTASNWPWDSYRADIKKIDILGEITVIGGTRLDYMFSGMTNLEEFNLIGSLIGKPESAISMFENCTKLKEINLSNFESNSTIWSMQNLAKGCTSLETFILNNPNFISRVGTNITTDASLDVPIATGGSINVKDMFMNCPNLKEIDMSNITLYGRTNNGATWDSFKNIFKNHANLTTVKLNNTKLYYMPDLKNLFSDCPKLSYVEIKGDNPFINTRDLSQLFHNSITNPEANSIVDLSGLGALNSGTQLVDLFNEGNKLETLILDNLDNSVDIEAPYSYSFGYYNLGLNYLSELVRLGAENSKIYYTNVHSRNIPFYSADTDNKIAYINNKQIDFYRSGWDNKVVTLTSKRDYIDIITDRQDTTTPDADTNKNLIYDINQQDNGYGYGGGILPAGNYYFHDTWQQQIILGEQTTYRIGNIENSTPTVTIHTNKLKNSTINGNKIIHTNYENIDILTPTHGDSVIIEDNSPLVTIIFPDAAVKNDGSNDKFDVKVTINKIEFTNISHIPLSSDRTVDANAYVFSSYAYNLTRPVIKYDTGKLELMNYVWDTKRDYDFSLIKKDSGTHIDFNIEVVDAEPDSTILFYVDDLDIPASQDYTIGYDENGDDNTSYDYLLWEDTHYDDYSEGIILGNGNDLNSVVRLATHSGLKIEGNYIHGTGTDPSSLADTKDGTTGWSGFIVKANAQGADYTWVNGVGCTTELLRETSPETIHDITVKKRWNDLGTDRPDNLEITLTYQWPDPIAIAQSGNPDLLTTVTVNSISSNWVKNGDEWTYKFISIPDTAVNETITENCPDLYTNTEATWINTRTYLLENTQTHKYLYLTKLWEDNDNKYGKRPTNLDVTVITDTVETLYTIDLSQSGLLINNLNDATTVEIPEKFVSIISLIDDRTGDIVQEETTVNNTDEVVKVVEYQNNRYLAYYDNDNNKWFLHPVATTDVVISQHTYQSLTDFTWTDSWTAKIKVGVNETIKSANENVPSGYLLTNTEINGNNIELTNTLETYDLTLSKTTVNDINGSFQFKVKIGGKVTNYTIPMEIFGPMNESYIQYGHLEYNGQVFTKSDYSWVEDFYSDFNLNDYVTNNAVNSNEDINFVSVGINNWAVPGYIYDEDDDLYYNVNNTKLFAEIPSLYFVPDEDIYQYLTTIKMFSENMKYQMYGVNNNIYGAKYVVFLDDGQNYNAMGDTIFASVFEDYYLDLSSYGTVTSNNGEYIITLDVPNNSTITIPDIPKGYNYSIEEIVPTDWQVISTNPQTGTITQDASISFTNKKIRTEVIINKKSSTNADLTGATVELYRNDILLDTLSLGSETLSLENGTYTLKETIVPIGYNNSEDIIFIVEDGKIYNLDEEEITEIDIIDEPILANLTILKVDSEDNTIVLADATFELVNTETNETYIGTTDSEGIYVFMDSPEGEYQLRELTAPFGYELNPDTITITISDNRTEEERTIGNDYIDILSFEETVENELSKGSIKIIKLDKDTDAPMRNIQFNLYGISDAGIEIDLYEYTNNDGEIEWLDIPIGYYTLEEVEVPNGYIDNPYLEEIYISAYSYEEYTIYNEIQKYDLTIDKTVTGNMGNKSKDFEFNVKIWKEEQDNTQYEYINFIGVSGGDGDQNPDWNLYTDITFSYQGKTFEPGRAYTMYRVYGGGSWYGFNNEYRGTADSSRPDLSYENRIEGPYDDALISFFEALMATPFVDTGSLEMDDYMPPNDAGEKIIIQGEEYPLFAAGYNSQGCEHAYTVFYGKPAIQKTYIDLSSQGGVDNGDGSYTFKLKHGESFTIPDIPYGYKYEVTENDYSDEGYTQYVNNDLGRDITGQLTEDTTVDFVNDLTVAVPTKTYYNPSYMLYVLLLPTVYLIRRKIRNGSKTV